MVSRLKNLRDLVYSIIRKRGVGKGPGITNIGTNTLKLNQEAMDIIAEMQKAGYKLENIDEASIKIFLNNRNQPAPTGKEIIDSMKETDIYSQDNHVATLENYTGFLIEDWQIILMNEELSNI